MAKIKKIFALPLIIGIGFIIEALIFRFFIISPYRIATGSSEGILNFNTAIPIMIFLKVFFWIGIIFLAVGCFMVLSLKINLIEWVQHHGRKKKLAPQIILVMLLLTIFIMVKMLFILSIIVSFSILSLLLSLGSKPTNKLKKHALMMKEKIQKLSNNKKTYVKRSFSILVIIFLIYLLVPSIVQPNNLPNARGEYYIQNGRVYNVNNHQELRLMGWDYHWVHFNGPGQAWEDSAKMQRFDKDTIRQDLIWASEAGNFIRICANWFEIEQTKGIYDYSTLDYVFDLIESDPNIGELNVLLEIGPIKTSKIWVQASLPEWFPFRIDLQDPNFIEMVKPFLKSTVNRYKNRSCLFAYQLENEPDFMMTTVTDNDEDYIITGDVYCYLTWLDSYVNSIDPNHFTSINLLVNNLYQQKKLPPVDIIFYDYYGSIENTAPLPDYARKNSQYLTGNTGFGVAELQLNNWHYEITTDVIEEEYRACLDSGMTMILWSELHDPIWWDGSAVSPDNVRTEKYYKVQELYQDFQSADSKNILIIQFLHDFSNVLIFSLGMLSMVSVYFFADLVLKKKYNNDLKNNMLTSLIVLTITIPSLLIIYPYVSNLMLASMGIAIVNLIFAPLLLYQFVFNELGDFRYKRLKSLFLAILSSMPLTIISFIGFY